MPKGPKGQKRPADVISNAVHVMQIATGETTETIVGHAKDPAAVALGRRGGLARAASLTKAERVSIASRGGKALQRARASKKRRERQPLSGRRSIRMLAQFSPRLIKCETA